MIKKIGLKNFKSYGKKQEIELKPITLLFGPNSAGKSSIWQSLVYLDGAIKSLNPDVYQTERTHGYIDFDGIKSVKNKNSSNSEFEISFTSHFYINNLTISEIEKIDLASKKTRGSDTDRLIMYKGSPSFDLNVKLLFDSENSSIKFLNITCNQIFIQRHVYKKVPEAQTNTDFGKYSFFQSLRGKIFATLEGALEAAQSGEEWYRCCEKNELVLNGPGPLLEIEYNKEPIVKFYNQDAFNFIFKSDKNRTMSSTTFKSEIEKIAAFRNDVHDDYFTILKNYLLKRMAESRKKMMFLGLPITFGKDLIDTPFNLKILPLKTDPEKIEEYQLDLIHIYSEINEILRILLIDERKFAPSYIRSTTKNEMEMMEESYDSTADNFAFQCANMVYLGYFREVPDLNLIRREFVNSKNESWKRVFENGTHDRLNQYIDEKFPELAYHFSVDHQNGEFLLVDRITKDRVNPKSIGVGISQLMPIIGAAFANEKLLHIVEQPELHLHPSLQAKVPAIFIDSYYARENQFIIETHSEHIVRALQLEIARFKTTGKEHGVNPEVVAVYYISKDEKGNSIVKKMELNENGDFVEPWPDDFFDSATDLTMERLKILSGSQSN